MRILNPTISGSLVISGSTTIYGILSASTITGDGSGLTGVTSYTDSDTLSYINSIGVVSGSVNWDTLIGKPSGIVSSSSQLSTEISGAFTSVSASIANDINSISTDFADITNKPTLVSSSLQIDYNSIQNQPTIPTNNNELTNGAGYTTCVGDITGVTAGTGLGGGGTSGDVTLSVNADQRGNVTLIGPNTSDYIYVQGTVIDFRLDGALDMRLENDGDLHVDGNVIAYSTTTSDERLKDNIETLNNSLDNIRKLRGVSYVWKKGGREGQKDIGVVAQEIEKVFPELVREVKLPTLDIEDTTKYKTVDYDKLSPIIIEAIKELSNRLEHLENKLDNNGITK